MNAPAITRPDPLAAHLAEDARVITVLRESLRCTECGSNTLCLYHSYLRWPARLEEINRVRGARGQAPLELVKPELRPQEPLPPTTPIALETVQKALESLLYDPRRMLGTDAYYRGSQDATASQNRQIKAVAEQLGIELNPDFEIR